MSTLLVQFSCTFILTFEDSTFILTLKSNFSEVNLMSFSSRLRQAREQAGLTQQSFADKIGVTKSAIGNYENGVSSPKWDVLIKIFDALQVEPNFLYQDDFTAETPSSTRNLTTTQTKLLDAFDQLNDEGQTKAVEYVEDLVLAGRYKKPTAHNVAAKGA